MSELPESPMKASIYAQLPSGIDVTLEVAAEARAELENSVNALVTNLNLNPRGAVGLGSGVKEDANAPKCDCGAAMQFKKGTSKSGKDWKGWFCTKAGSQCPPIWE